MKIHFIYSLILLSMIVACESKTKSQVNNDKQSEVKSVVPSFNADSAYLYTQHQVEFGPRIPNTQAHESCGDYFVLLLNQFGAQVTEQKVNLTNYAGTILKSRNIIASFRPENKNRILICAHWDTRPYADHDPNPDNWRKPIDGADDGASGCGILLEIARQIQLQQPLIGVDLVFFDAEDWGVPSFDRSFYRKSGYCLGSEYWAQHPHVPNYTAKYGILLDLAGASGATFYKEGYSVRYASPIVNKVWEAAQINGYGDYFIQTAGNSIEDDHVQVMKHLHIPCIDIIHCDPNTNSGFGPYWHTLNDNMSNISKETLKAVGQTVLHVLYNEK